MKKVDLMNVLAHASRSKTNRDLAIMAGIGILVIGGVCYYYYMQNHNLKRVKIKHIEQISEMSSEISSLKENNNNIQEKIKQINKENSRISAELYELKKTSKKDA